MDDGFALDPSLSKQFTYSARQPLAFTEPRVALLTGATGFLGTTLLRDLLAHTSLDVVCLVRGSSEVDGTKRVRRALQHRKLWRPDCENRIRAVAGDLTWPRCGLSDREFTSLSTQIDVIYHCAALVNLVLPYKTLRATNVLGTVEILRLAAVGSVNAFHHISSITALAPAESDDASLVVKNCCIGRSLDGYAKSKVVAEQLIHHAADRGLGVVIYRPGLMTGDSRTGICNLIDILSLVLSACIRLGVAPGYDGVVYLTPVDIVSRTIVKLSQIANIPGRTFNITNPRPVLWAQVTSILHSQGYVRRIAPYSEWLKLVREHAESTSREDMRRAAALLSESPPSYRSPGHAQDSVNQLLTAPEGEYPKDDNALLTRYLRFLAAEGDRW